ncbi:RIP metalloprotease RseP [Diplocloster agilis]|uniref:Zinc metalloprotease n=1 Tax=Diplocloster agilis TaxID=2850323 RepID=A0A949K0C7_9FIRM|nr:MULTISPECIES: RIP metalloprotease RseP [Lachnospiraceae]MBU9736450.1 RIP metalloprotease RseP [Diplocloster agilis]MBU9745662.1 RIP metalloprotease RseP [Diplocloster agilis]MCU6735057.1 RIP metalloprotease RseP [Suonthocola fibrivorans]SCJ63185.1 Zinc metalloprotease rasP [uncultured Clostridium sp.]
MKIVIAILIFSALILFHEFGHFLLAKKNGICVTEFCLGLGPTLIGVQKGETKYSLKLLPFGGACVMLGEDGLVEDERSFGAKSVWARMSVVAAGPIFNFILAFVGAVIIIGNIGFDKPSVYEVIPDYPMAEAGIQAGDIIKKVDGSSVHVYREFNNYMQFNQSGSPVEVVYERDGKEYTTLLTPKFNEKEGRYLLGVRGPGPRVKGNALQTLQYSFYEVEYWIKATFQSLKMLFTGQVGINDLSGPVGIVNVVGESYEQVQEVGGTAKDVWLTMLNWLILLSANLGVMNLLPIPALDGGRLVFLVIEAIRGKPIDPEKEGMVHFTGLILLLALMLFVMFNDIHKLL